jgi:hypothetical protein
MMDEMDETPDVRVVLRGKVVAAFVALFLRFGGIVEGELWTRKHKSSANDHITCSLRDQS